MEEQSKKTRAFRYLNAARRCRARYADSHATMLVLTSLAEHTDKDAGDAFPSYQTLMHQSGISDKSTLACALARLTMTGVLSKKRRYSKTSVYQLNLARMRDLRFPVLKDFQRGVLADVNAKVLGITNKKDNRALTHDEVIAQSDDAVIWEALKWLVEGGDAGIDPRNYANGYIHNAAYLIEAYPEIRSAYFRAKGLEETPLADPTESYDCLYCDSTHLGGCDLEKVKKLNRTLSTAELKKLTKAELQSWKEARIKRCTKCFHIISEESRMGGCVCKSRGIWREAAPIDDEDSSLDGIAAFEGNCSDPEDLEEENFSERELARLEELNY